MTEKQAWLKLAKMWDEARVDASTGLSAPTGSDSCGLCPCIYLDIGDLLSCDVTESMIAKIEELPSLNCQGFRWKTNLEGAKSRAAFCRKQAALLAKRKAKVKK